MHEIVLKQSTLILIRISLEEEKIISGEHPFLEIGIDFKISFFTKLLFVRFQVLGMEKNYPLYLHGIS